MMTTFNSILILFFIIAQFYCHYSEIELISRQNDIISELSWDITKLEHEIEFLKSHLSQLEEVE